MTEPIIDFAPLDSSGLTKNVAPYLAKWSTLTNVIFLYGRLRPRPGFRELWDWRDKDYPAVARGVPLVIAELPNPGSTNGNRSGTTFASETLIPNGSSDLVAGWTGSHLDIDETVPNGTDIMSTSTAGAQKSLTWSDPVNTPTVIPGVVIFCRARASILAAKAVLKFYWREGGVNYLVHTETVSSSKSSETDDWTTFSFEINRDPAATGSATERLTKAEITAMNIVVEYAGGQSLAYQVVRPESNGTYTSWTDATDGGAATYTDIQWAHGVWPPIVGPGSNEVNNGITTSTVDAKQSWIWTSGWSTTYSSINSIAIVGSGTTETAGSSSIVQVIYRSAGVDYNVGSPQVFKSTPGMDSSFREFGLVSLQASSAVNPKTGVAWTQADLSGGEFGVQFKSGAPVTFSGIFGIVEGSVSSAAVQIDWMSAHLMENSGIGHGVLGKDRIWITDKAMLRLDDDATRVITDITNSVAVTSPPNMPMDASILYGQIYAVNGIDATRVYPNAGALFTALTTNNADGATKITGRTVMAFADRIIYGWVTDNTSVIPERVAYSKEFDGSTHNDPSAGNFDLLPTSGGIIKLLPLSEDVAVAYKQAGIYNLRRTGSSVAPIVPDLIDWFTGTSAPRTVQTTLSPEGTPVHLFLGQNPVGGTNVYKYDGSTASAIGDGIQNALRRDLNFDAIYNAFAACDTENGLYYLFIPEGTQLFPKQGYIYHLRHGVWTRFELPFEVNCAGIWSIPALALDAFTGVSFTYPDTPATDAPKRVIVGLLGGRLVALDFDAAYDARWPATALSLNVDAFSNDGGSNCGENKINFTSTIETGDPRPVQHPSQQMAFQRLHLVYTSHSPADLTVNASANGGASYSSSPNAYTIGSVTNDGAYRHAVLDLPGIYAHRPRVKLALTPTIPTAGQNSQWEIAEMWLEGQQTGDDP